MAFVILRVSMSDGMSICYDRLGSPTTKRKRHARAFILILSRPHTSPPAKHIRLTSVEKGRRKGSERPKHSEFGRDSEYWTSQRYA